MKFDHRFRYKKIMCNIVTHYFLQKLCQNAHSTYLVRLPPLLGREEELPDVRILPPEEYPPDERIVPDDVDRIDDEEERVVLVDERTGAVLEDRVTLVELLRTGVLVVVVRTGVAVVRVVVVVERLGAVVVRV
jgi:hypothetical protein